MTHQPTRILIVGGGYAGMYTAHRLQKKLRRGEATVTVVDPNPTMTYQPFLAEVAAGSIEARHVVVPLRQVLHGCEIITGTVSGIDHARHRAAVDLSAGATLDVGYDVLVMAPGSVSRTLPIPGLAESGIGFSTLGEATYLRNHVLGQLDRAAMLDGDSRRTALTFAVIGGGYAGVEVLAELEDLVRYAVRYYPELSASDLRWVLVEATERILPEVSGRLGDYAMDRLRERGIKVRVQERVTSMSGGQVRLAGGDTFDAETIVWTTGVRANPLIARTGLPVDTQGRLVCAADLRARGVEDVWGAGDSAAVPDLAQADDPSAQCGPSAQHALRQAKRLADNVLAVLRGRQPKPYRHAYAGSVASLGLHKGVAEIYGVRLRGWAAWFLHRTYHLAMMPTLNRKMRVAGDWTVALFFRREIIALEQVQRPRRTWEAAIRSTEAS